MFNSNRTRKSKVTDIFSKLFRKKPNNPEYETPLVLVNIDGKSTVSHLKYDKDGNLYSDFNYALVSPSHSQKVLQCHNCGFLIKVDPLDKSAVEVDQQHLHPFPRVICPECGCWLLNERQCLFVDPVVFSLPYMRIEKDLKAQMDKEFPPESIRFGDCHGIWYRKQQILLEQYHIRWRTPSEMNPGVMFD